MSAVPSGSSVPLASSVPASSVPAAPPAGSLAARPDHQVISVAASYKEAQATVDYLSDAGFPVEHLRIVGSNLQSVEQVTGRVTKGRAALTGAASGAWFGLFVGLLLGIFVVVGGGWLVLLLVSLLIGAFWGALFGFVAHWTTRGQRDFASVKQLVAGQYEVLVDAPHAAQATELLAGRR